LNDRQRRVGIDGVQHAVAEPCEQIGRGRAHGGVVFDDENRLGAAHGGLRSGRNGDFIVFDLPRARPDPSRTLSPSDRRSISSSSSIKRPTCTTFGASGCLRPNDSIRLDNRAPRCAAPSAPATRFSIASLPAASLPIN
jgi:hypothetical protein